MSRTNKVILLGRIGKDIESSILSSGSTVATCSFVTEDSYKGKDNKWTKTSEWHKLVAYGPMADSLAKNCSKGSALFVEGHLHTSSWDDKNGGGKRYKTEVVIENWTFQQGSSNQSQPVEPSEGIDNTGVASSSEIDDQDLPF